MKPALFRSAPWMVCAATFAILIGCSHTNSLAQRLYQRPSQAPLGTISDSVWKNMEANAEASDFVIYQHEFRMNSARLNMGGEDHVKKIAQRLQQCHDLPVVIERSMISTRPDTEFQYPVHPNPSLDMERREAVVRALLAMGVADADTRVVVAPAYAPGMPATEAAEAYQRGLSAGSGYGYGGFGSFGGGAFGPFSGFGFGGF